MARDDVPIILSLLFCYRLLGKNLCDEIVWHREDNCVTREHECEYRCALADCTGSFTLQDMHFVLV